MTLLEPGLLWLLPLAPLLALFQAWGIRRRRRWQETWGLSLHRSDRLRPWLSLFAMALAILALARPVWDGEPVTAADPAQDAVFLVDVSRSMETADLSGQTRLEAVRQALGDLALASGGDRLALVAFAGTTVVKSPLTSDMAYFRQAVAALDPLATSRGGTLLGDAIRDVQKKFLAEGRTVSLWILTDGGDQESFPVEAAQAFAAAGGRLFVWGVGTLSGGTVPERGVSSALNEPLLREVVEAARAAGGKDGRYWGVDTPIWRLGDEYRAHRAVTGKTETTRVIWQEGAWWLLWPIGVLLALDALLAKRRVRG